MRLLVGRWGSKPVWIWKELEEIMGSVKLRKEMP